MASSNRLFASILCLCTFVVSIAQHNSCDELCGIKSHIVTFNYNYIKDNSYAYGEITFTSYKVNGYICLKNQKGEIIIGPEVKAKSVFACDGPYLMIRTTGDIICVYDFAGNAIIPSSRRYSGISVQSVSDKYTKEYYRFFICEKENAAYGLCDYSGREILKPFNQSIQWVSHINDFAFYDYNLHDYVRLDIDRSISYNDVRTVNDLYASNSSYQPNNYSYNNNIDDNYYNSGYSSLDSDNSYNSTSTTYSGRCPKSATLVSTGGCIGGTFECTTCALQSTMYTEHQGSKHRCSNCGIEHDYLNPRSTVGSGRYGHKCRCNSGYH